MKDYEQDEEKSKKKRIILIILLILLLLLLITSCTSRFFGTIGGLFRNEGIFEITDDNNQSEIILNRELMFDRDIVNIRLSDLKVKLGYHFTNIDPREFTCSTTDASIATCYVSDGYVVINPKSVGEVVITLQTIVNGKVYQATSKITIAEADRYIDLSSNAGTINLYYGNRKNVSYSLVGISGNVVAISSDESVATVKVLDGVIQITAHKTGTTQITVQVDYNGTIYTNTYILTVIHSSGSSSTTQPGSGSSTGGNSSTHPNIPGKPDDPNHPDTPDDPAIHKDGNSLLKSLTISSGALTFNPNIFSYVVGVGSNISNVSLEAIASSTKAKVTYQYQGQIVNDLNDLQLQTGDNTVLIVVTAEDGTVSTYRVVINRAQSTDNSLSNIKVSHGELSPQFKPDTLNYGVVVDSEVSRITIWPTLSNEHSKVQYKYHGKYVENLDDLELVTGDNKVEIIVTSEQGVSRTYTVVVTKKASDNNYLSNLTSNETIHEEFKKDVNHYTIDVSADTKTVTLDATLDDSRSHVIYRLNGKEVESLENLPLVDGDNKIEIVVISESGKENPYVVIVNKHSSDNNYLSDIRSTFELNEAFQKEKNDYTMNVLYNTNTITLDAVREDSRSSVVYRLNGKEVKSLENLPLQDGDNVVEILVTSQSGKENLYKVTIHKPVRTIQIEKEDYTIRLEEIPYQIIYTVFEDGNEITNYNIQDISASLSNYKGTYEVKQGYIEITPDYSMKNKTSKLTLSYLGKTHSSNLKFLLGDYYLYSYSDTYDIAFANGSGYKNIVLNTNLFPGEVTVTKIAGGIRITSNTNSSIYVDIVSDSSIVVLSSENGEATSSIVVRATANQSGTANLKVSGYAFGNVIDQFSIRLNIIEKHHVTIDANGGFFDEFTSKYQFLLTPNDTINLADYVSYKVDESGNCMYYTLVSYNTKQDGTGKECSLSTVLSNIHEDITLYAMYSSDSQYIELEEHKYLYLAEVDLFHNEEYYEKYNEDKVIYPGAQGSYVMTFENNSAEEIIITGMGLEEDTICFEGKGCLNMGYIIKYASKTDANYTYAYGSSTAYEILNKDSRTTRVGFHTKNDISFGKTISIPKGEAAEISLLWEWVDVDDELDTLIGNNAVHLNDKYDLRVRIDFQTKNKYCSTD